VMVLVEVPVLRQPPREAGEEVRRGRPYSVFYETPVFYEMPLFYEITVFYQTPVKYTLGPVNAHRGGAGVGPVGSGARDRLAWGVGRGKGGWGGVHYGPREERVRRMRAVRRSAHIAPLPGAESDAPQYDYMHACVYMMPL
jgi:hypothetical protein